MSLHRACCPCSTDTPAECDCLLTSAHCSWTGEVEYGAACGYGDFFGAPYWVNAATIAISGSEYTHTWPAYPDPGCLCCGDAAEDSGPGVAASPIPTGACSPPPAGPPWFGGSPVFPTQTAKINIRKPQFVTDGSVTYWRCRVSPTGPSGLASSWLLEFRKYAGSCPTGSYILDVASSSFPDYGAQIAGAWGTVSLTPGQVIVS